MDTPRIPVNSLSRHVAPLREALAVAAGEVIGSGYFVLGPAVAKFEAEFAAYCGVGHAVGVANGTDALEIALKSVGVGPGDAVLVAANAAMYGTSAVLACGARPVFVDVLEGEATLDPDGVAARLASESAVKAVVVTHLYGRLAHVERIVAHCRARGVAVVEDCAQAHGARDAAGRRAGSFGDVAAFSFYPTKNLGALGDGGAVVSSDGAIAGRARQFRQYGWSGKYVNELPGGRNSRLDEIQAAMLSVMLPHLDAWNARRRAIGNRYSAEIRTPALELPPVAGDESVAHLYVVRSDRRDEVRQALAEAGIHTDVHYPFPDHRQPCHGGRFDAVSLPVTERDAERVLTLPCFPEMTDDEVTRVIDACSLL